MQAQIETVEPNVTLTMTKTEADQLFRVMGYSCVSAWEGYVSAVFYTPRRPITPDEASAIGNKVYLTLNTILGGQE